MTLPVVKHSYLITDINEIPRVVKEAFHIAQTGRPGPVLIDLPKMCNRPRRNRCSHENQYARLRPRLAASDLALNEIIGLIEKSERPCCTSAAESSPQCQRKLRRFAEAAQIPVTSTIMGCARIQRPPRFRFAGWACTARPTLIGRERRIRTAQRI